jgi:predicted DNA-binding transcriptional regulator AlpA
MTTIQNLRPLLNVKQVAELLGVKTRTVYDLAALADKEPSNPKALGFMFRVGGSWRARPRDVEQWIDQRANVRYQ